MCFQWKSVLNCKARNYFPTQLFSSAAPSLFLSVLSSLPSPSLQFAPASLQRRALERCILAPKAEARSWGQLAIIAALCVPILRASRGRHSPGVWCSSPALLPAVCSYVCYSRPSPWAGVCCPTQAVHEGSVKLHMKKWGSRQWFTAEKGLTDREKKFPSQMCAIKHCWAVSVFLMGSSDKAL